MAAIKSALEIAMERTKDLKVDQKALAATAARNEGKKLAGEFLANPEATDIAKKLSALTKDKQKDARAGVFEVLSSRVQLPLSAASDPGIEHAPLAAAFKALASGPLGDKKITGLFEQLTGFLKQYLEDAKHIDEAVRKQYAPRLKQKEQELSSRSGRPVHLDPMNDPEFMAFYKQNVGQLKTQYQEALDKAKADLAGICGIEAEKNGE